MGFISDDKIREIRERTDLITLVSERVSLKKAGSNFLGLCPFHAEKTPSFQVNPTKQFYYCFGCQKSGDALQFLMDAEGLSFSESVEDLARRAGIVLDPLQEDGLKEKEAKTLRDSEKKVLLEMNEWATRFFEERLDSSKTAIAYLQKRGINKETQRKFRLGYAPNQWEDLLRFLVGKKFSETLIEKAGLIIHRNSENMATFSQGLNSYDRFRNRLMFPVFNLSGQVVAFGGRILQEAENSESEKVAKYINSPETPIYKKGEHLYGGFLAKEAIRQKKEVLLVEGNFDVLALQERGFSHVVASMGTALTDTQIRLLKRLLGDAGHVILMLDGDRAGRQAVLKDIGLFLKQNLQDLALFTENQVDVRVAILPDGEDPDTYIAKNPHDFEERIKGAKPALDYVIEQAIQSSKNNGVSEKVKVISDLVPLLQTIKNPTALDLYVMKLASSLAVEERTIFQQVRRRFSSQNQSVPVSIVSTKEQSDPNRILDPITKNLLSFFGDHPQQILYVEEEVLNRLENPVVAEVLREAKYRIQQGFSLQPVELIDLAPKEIKDTVASAVFSGIFIKVEDPKRTLDSILHTIYKRFLQREMNQLKKLLELAYQEGNQVRVLSLSAQMKEVMDQLINFSDNIQKKVV